ncbi:MAG: hypothetical protein OES25_03250 [Acidobacteriota bacterium]|nr:hypothetical protein [Acidobacteriota bacterium]
MNDLVWVTSVTDRLRSWIAANGPTGSDPYDALNSPLATLVSPFGKWGRILFLQGARRAGLSRRLLRVPATVNAKGVALLAHAELELATVRDDERIAGDGLARLRWLRANAVGDESGPLGWGYPFDWAARAFFIPRDTPSVVVTTTVADAFLAAGQRLPQGRDWARQSARFVTDRLRRTEAGETVCFSYTPIDHSCVLNASLRGASLLAAFDEPDLRDLTRRATRFVLDQQRDDGSWPYGLAIHHRWVDGHHTGFVLRDLASIARHLDWERPLEAARRGLEFYRRRLLEDDGRPVHRLHQPWPADIHAAAEAILVMTDPLLASMIEDGPTRALRTLRWTVDKLGREDGAFGYTHRPGRTDLTPHLRWGQAWMLRALAALERSLASVG